MADEHEVQPVAEDAVPVKSLVEGRAKRSTAGRLMSTLLDAEADDDLALLFEEIEDDNEFDVAADEEGAEEDDMGMDSSSDDDDDQGPNARADDFEGEKQLEKEEKAEKKKRRAQQDLRFKIASKKVKIDPTAVPAAPAPRPKKKSERISWIPTPDDGPTRSSSRRQTMQNKELTHARLKDSEEKRVRLIATMEEAAKRKAQFKPKEMTQAERLAEAERVERHNSKSLNRWEEMEKRKAEERRAKIEALQNRRLEGPVMSYWSGVATWVNGRITRLGKVDVTPKPEKEETARRKSKKSEKEGKNVVEQKSTEDATAAESATSQTAPLPTSESTANPAPSPSAEGEPLKQDGDTPQTQQASNDPLKGDDGNGGADAAMNSHPAAPSTAADQSSTPAADNARVPDTTGEAQATGEIAIEQPKETAPAEVATELLPKEEPEVIKQHEKAEETSKESAQEAQEPSQLPNQPTSKPDQPAKPELLLAEANLDEASKPEVSEPVASANDASEDATAAKAVSPSAPETTSAAVAAQPDQQERILDPAQKEQESPTIHVDQTATATGDVPQPEIPEAPPVIEQTGRSLTVLENFDDKTAQSREFSIYFNAKKPPRLTKISASLCVITSLPSRYRDPETSLPFANAYAYNEIRHTVAQKYAWSPMLGCYVGPTGVAARGVPERFLGGPQAASDGKDSEQKESSGNGQPVSPEKDKEGDTNPSDDVPSASKRAPPATPTPVTADAGSPMEVD